MILIQNSRQNMAKSSRKGPRLAASFPNTKRQYSRNIMTLNSLRRGSRARVVEVDYSDAKLVAKFAARGLVPGAELSIVKSGDPLLVFIDETRWALSDVEARKVSVETLNSTNRSLIGSLRNLWR